VSQKSEDDAARKGRVHLLGNTDRESQSERLCERLADAPNVIADPVAQEGPKWGCESRIL